MTIKPGVYKNGTRYQAKGRWYDANLVRWYEGIMGPIGGWRNVKDTQSLFNISVGDELGTATGTQSSTTLKDTSKTWTTDQWKGRIVTLTAGTGVGLFATVASNTVDTLTIVGSWSITPVAASTHYIISGRPRNALGWKTNNGVSVMGVGTTKKLWLYVDGAVTDITPAGLANGVIDGAYTQGGYGTGQYGVGYYGTGTGAITLHQADSWQIDNFGENIVACWTADGRIFSAPPTGAQATPVTNAPTSVIGVVVTPERFLVALGGTGSIDPNPDARRIRWASQETTTTWTPAATNSAGEFELTTKGKLMAGRRTRRQTLLWTDVDMYSMTFTAGSDVYAFDQLGDNCGLIGPNAMCVIGDLAFWMSYGKFFLYDGALKPIPCDVVDFVFQDLNQQQRSKIVCVPNTLFDEIVWFYPSASQVGTENDRYVAYNYREQHWTIGTLGRSAGIDRGVYDFPVLLDKDGFVYEHEVNDLRTGAGVAFAESGPVELTDADFQANFSGSPQLMAVNRFIPDEKTLGDVRMKFFTAKFPTDTETVIGPFNASQPTSLRFMARQARVRVEEVNPVRWRVGVPRLGVKAAGYR